MRYMVDWRSLFRNAAWQASLERNERAKPFGQHFIAGKNEVIQPLSIAMQVSDEARIVLRKMLEFNECDRIGWDELFTMVLKLSTFS